MALAHKEIRRNGLVASAQRIDVSDRRQANRIRAARQDWQDESYGYFNDIGEVKYYCRYKGNALARLRLFVATTLDDDETPIAADDEQADLPSALVAAANEALDRLKKADGGTGEMLRSIGTNLEVAGEVYLVGRMEEQGETWGVHSVNEIAVSGDTWKLKSNPTDQGETLGADDVVLRIWQRHPQWGALADSAMRGVLEICDELLILNRSIRAAGRSRAAGAGLLLVPDGLSFGSVDHTADESDGEARGDPFTADLMEAMVTPIQDEGSASAVVPNVIRGDPELMKEVRLVILDRPLDPIFGEQRMELIKRLGQGLDAPPEIITGISDTNHWGSWQVDESMFKSHIEPLALTIVEALTVGFLRTLLADQFGPEELERVFIWYDPVELVSHPNRAVDAKDAYNADALSAEALRKNLGFSDEDAPEPIELLVKAFLRRPIFDPSAGPALFERLLGIPAPMNGESPPAPAPGESPPPAQQSPEITGPPAREGITASARKLKGLALGKRLVEMDRNLRTRLQIAADAALSRALERAGARLRSKTGKTSKTKLLEHVPQQAVAATLGPAMVAAMGMGEDELLESAFDGLEGQFRRWIADAQGETLDLLEGFLGELGASRAGFESRQAISLDEAWGWFRSAMLDLARSRLYDPSPEAPALGELDESVGVPIGLVRQAVARAGGAEGLVTSPEGGAFVVLEQSGTEPIGGIGTGRLAMEILTSEGGGIEGYEWTYGPAARTRPFEPHEDLDGISFTSFDDPALASDGWPGEFYLPGDHFGCVCDVIPVLLSPQEVADMEVFGTEEE